MTEECSLNNEFLENSPNIKEEFEDESCDIDVFETCISANDTELKDNVWNERIEEYKKTNPIDDAKIELSLDETNDIVVNDNVKIEKEISPSDIKIKFDSKLLFCDHCNEYYEDYCRRCEMLTHILNGITLSITDGRAIKGIPNDILEIRESSGRLGVFASKVIPEGVKMGPFDGFSTSKCPWRIKGGKFIVPKDKSKHWMQYINPAMNIFQQNLIPFQRENKLYYHCNREILVGEELLVYFGEEYEDSINKDIEVDFIAPAEYDVKDVFACTLCCLGFSSRGYLAKHKSTCPNDIIRRFSIDEIIQCPFCNIYLYKKEYLECHMPYYCERNVSSKCVSLAFDNQTVKVNRSKARRLQVYKCTQCKYKTSYKSVLRSHLNKHYEVKMYRCKICSRQFKTKGSLTLHVKFKHIDVEGKVGQTGSKRDYMTKYKNYFKTHVKTKRFNKFSHECEICDYKANYKQQLQTHVKSKHLKQFSYECEICDYKVNYKQQFEIHVKSKHLKQFNHECEKCNYKTNQKSHFETHVKSEHLKQFSYECEKCDYKSNHRLRLAIHVKSKHLKQFSYECEICDYKVNYKQQFEIHVKSKHLKQFSYECAKCDYKTNQKTNLETHVKTIHLKQFRYECEKCDYKSNQKRRVAIHVKSKHLKQFSYECEICDYKSNQKAHFETHVKSKHLKQFSYKCEGCDYKTNGKSDLERHVKSNHLKQFGYECEMCYYKTNKKQSLERHVKSIHLKQFSYQCENCVYKTNYKHHFEGHVKSKHLKQFSCECEICDYKTNDTLYFADHMVTEHHAR